MGLKYTIHTDGGSRGNPGPAAIGVVIENSGIGKKKYGEFLGKRTNNEAEYEAIIFALKKLKLLVGKSNTKDSSIEVIVDSELVAKQLNGQFKIKDEKIKDLFLKVWNLKMDFGEVTFRNVPREKNKEADKLVNQILDIETNKLL